MVVSKPEHARRPERHAPRILETGIDTRRPEPGRVGHEPSFEVFSRGDARRRVIGTRREHGREPRDRDPPTSRRRHATFHRATSGYVVSTDFRRCRPGKPRSDIRRGPAVSFRIVCESCQVLDSFTPARARGQPTPSAVPTIFTESSEALAYDAATAARRLLSLIKLERHWAR